MDIKIIIEDLRAVHYKIYELALENKKLSDLDQSLVFLSSNAFYELDSLFLLVNNKKYHGTDSLCRNILEKLIYLKFILEKDSLNRARDFMLSNFKLKVDIYEKTSNLYPDVIPIYSPDEIKEIKLKYKNKKFTSKDKYKWYGVDGVNSISKLFKKYNEDIYGYYYMKYSGEVHSNDLISKFINMTEIIRKNEEYDNSEAVYISLEAFSDILHLIINHYNLDHEFTSFSIPKEYTIKL